MQASHASFTYSGMLKERLPLQQEACSCIHVHLRRSMHAESCSLLQKEACSCIYTLLRRSVHALFWRQQHQGMPRSPCAHTAKGLKGMQA
jgi:hypothetical protein